MSVPTGARQADLRRRRADQSAAPPGGDSQPPVTHVTQPGTPGTDFTEPKPAESAERKGRSENFVPLPKSEIRLCAGITVCLVVYVLYCVYRFSEDHKDELNTQDLSPGWTILGREKDTRNKGWREFVKRMQTSFPLFYLGHVVLGAASARFLPKTKFRLYGVYGAGSLAVYLGWRPAGVVLLQAVVSFALSRLRRPMLIWGFAIIVTTAVFMEPGSTWHHNLVGSKAKYSIFMVTLTMSCLRDVSFGLEFCWETERNPAGYSLLDLLTYNFYWPLLTSGPIISYSDFRQQRLSQGDSQPGLQNLPRVLLDLVRLLFWFLCAEISRHYLYIHAICARMDVLQQASVFTLYGLIYAHIQFFHVKYVVLFGMGSTLARLDEISPPPQPKCVATVYQFTDMWRSFDPGLYKWLVRYIYWPLGGSRSATFMFVYFWHGGSHNLFIWAALQFFGVLLETLTRRFMRLPAIRAWELKHLSALSSRRLRTLLNTWPLEALAISNLVFLTSPQVGAHCVFTLGRPLAALQTAAILFCIGQWTVEIGKKVPLM
ncbi:PREDICTED: protein-cysteine N-palmitoyltransferase HHAT-like [Branchiostoma belcheri]|uniref:Protein-cysteine N-palmitoyltransferase HHAT-like n=1 Tax=Branchiostoma belcheri TaxID=7741 RepID=A0A6P4ZVC7_BRABE|nr:PREDICTED: protein-cysteine N-palmitoyltransferase HHAT-like [Branchiostoma belcheri]